MENYIKRNEHNENGSLVILLNLMLKDFSQVYLLPNAVPLAPGKGKKSNPKRRSFWMHSANEV